MFVFFIFFFKQKTAYEMRISDWSSDVCSSDLRSDARLGYRSGHYPRTLVTRVGKLELRVPQDRAGRFSTELFERYQRSEQALVATLAEMYVQGVSTRKVKAITEELCGHAFSASTISAINKK